VALLHSFFYEQARRIFTGVAEKDPNCAMAQWGIAMTWWHPIWTSPTAQEMAADSAAIDKAVEMIRLRQDYGGQEAGGGTTDRERKFVKALSAYYHAADGPASGAVGQSCHGPVGSRERALAYEKEMRELATQYPDDVEAQTFHALALLAIGYATPNDTTLSKQLEAAGILEKLRAKNPNHPGITHYLIHSYDYPALAERGLSAAPVYASHIFTRLGMWEESVAANRAAAGRLARVCEGATAGGDGIGGAAGAGLRGLLLFAGRRGQQGEGDRRFRGDGAQDESGNGIHGGLCAGGDPGALRAGAQRLGGRGSARDSGRAALEVVSVHGSAD
jgi:hypothetical protein